MVVLDVANEVVFVAEGTASLGAYLEELKSNYILPILQYFNGGPPEQVPYGCDFSNSLYALVTYNSIDVFPEPTSACNEPTTSTYQFYQTLTQSKFCGGGGDGKTFLAEGLASALQLFDELKQVRDPSVNTKRYCILLCNSEPCGMPSQDNAKYHSLMAEDLVSKLLQKDVKFSIISPRKIRSLYHLFDKNMTDAKLSQMKNYAVDSRHLVLIRGIQLEEQKIPLSPGPKMDENKAVSAAGAAANQNAANRSTMAQTVPFKTPATTMSSQPMGNRVGPNQGVPGAQMMTSHPGDTQPMQQQANVSNAGDMSGTPGGAMGGFPQPMNQTRMMNIQQQQRHALQQQAGNIQQGGNMQPGSAMQQSGFQRAPHPQQMGGGTGMNMQGVRGINPQQMTPGINPNPGISQPGMAPNNMPLGVDINNPIAAMQQNPGPQRNIIWSGTLEWQEKSKTPQGVPIENVPRVTKSMACSVSPSQGDVEISTARWPPKLAMQLIPQNILQPLQNLFHNSRSVTFHFENQDTENWRNFRRMMSSGSAGYVQMGNNQQSDIKVLMLLYSSRKNMFMGLIPTDQQAFITGIRQLYKQRAQMAQNKQLSGQAGANPGAQMGANFTGTQQPMPSSNAQPPRFLLERQSSMSPPIVTSQLPPLCGLLSGYPSPLHRLHQPPLMPVAPLVTGSQSMITRSTQPAPNVLAPPPFPYGLHSDSIKTSMANQMATSMPQSNMAATSTPASQMTPQMQMNRMMGQGQFQGQMSQPGQINPQGGMQGMSDLASLQKLKQQQAEQQKQHMGMSGQMQQGQMQQGQMAQGQMQQGQMQQGQMEMQRQQMAQQQLLQQQQLMMQQRQQQPQSMQGNLQNNQQLKHLLLNQQQMRQQQMMMQQRPRGGAPGTQPMMGQGQMTQAQMGQGQMSQGQMGMGQQGQQNFGTMGDDMNLDFNL